MTRHEGKMGDGLLFCERVAVWYSAHGAAYCIDIDAFFFVTDCHAFDNSCCPIVHSLWEKYEWYSEVF